uniref:THAP-type domain-containing protein n=2 Tax=Neogobius melanostomus TaxID=47308 RepID=A0A8C6T8F2_9GOBI
MGMASAYVIVAEYVTSVSKPNWARMVQCCVPSCNNRNDINKTISYYRFPLDENEKRRWLKLIRRKDFTPNYNSRVCGWHFPHGKAAGPTRFAWNEGKAFPHISQPTKRQKKMLLATVEDEGGAEPGPSHLGTAQKTPSSSSVLVLEIENEMLRKENDKLKKELEKQKQTFSFSQISSHPDIVNYYTGLPDAATVLFLETLLSKFDLQYHFDWNVQKMPLIDQLLLTLMKLRLNCGLVDLSVRFNCCRATVTNIFITISSALYDILYVGMMENKIPSRFKNQTSLPHCFQPFPNCRIVLDCTEVAVSNTESLDTQSHLYSHYKGGTTLKALIGVAPNGFITFASDLYGGSTSDKAITADCGVLQQLEAGDMVMADKGFTIRDILPAGVSLNIPTFLVNGQFTMEEINHNRLIASARVHVERSIQRLKTFHILSYIPYQYKKHANKILKVCVSLTNLQTPILREIA